ncbi:DUF6777 domain-containing protein [Streptacidiphilus anmyonensis]|uniref:DUF6777 domain-containing protein n=1 Tax=Streptacidiphilus anmyonensis TaxID=405782 RepID=UPI000693E641|nr:DUF6777 domain-containing protein [Streptacidiphilus anmyonensis]
MGKPPRRRRTSLLITAAVVLGLAVALTVVLLNRPASAQTVMLQPAGSTGPNPFNPPVHTGPSTSPTAKASHSAAPVPAGATSSANGVHTVSGTAVGLYGGTERVSSCDVPQMSAFLRANPTKGAAWAGVEGIRTDQIDAYLHSLTPVLLRTDTRVTNHGFANGAATSFQSVLEAGTAVLVDANGAPRARCACGNPLLAPVVTTRSSYTGTTWSTFNAQNVTVVLPAVTTVQVFVLYDPVTGQWFQRPTGGHGGSDVPVPPPVIGGASGSPGATSGSASASAKSSATASSTCLSGSPVPGTTGTGSPSPGQAQPCPSGSSASAASSSPASASASPSASASASPSTSAPSSPSASVSANTGASTGSGTTSAGTTAAPSS